MPYVSDLQAAELTFGPEMLATLAFVLTRGSTHSSKEAPGLPGSKRNILLLKVKKA